MFKLEFDVGEFDMVVADKENVTCEIYEIKHSTETVPRRYVHLVNGEKCETARRLFGEITGRYVIYRGKPTESDGVRHLNAEEYHKSLRPSGQI